jgi:tetraprenyl-beta-curcumene synthase
MPILNGWGACDPLDLLRSGNIPALRKSDPAPLDPRQAWALLGVAARELLWGLPAASRELQHWRVRAKAIPDRTLRKDALDSITQKRDHAHGAALFCVLPKSRSRRLLRLLVAYQTLWDFLDNLSERDTAQENGRQLHVALVEALDPGGPISDYYRYHPWKNDGGYLRALVEACREGCEALPSYPRVRPYVLEGVRRCSIQSINHDIVPERRDAALRDWAEREFPGESSMRWFELTAAASAFIPHALLALAVEPSCEDRDIAQAGAVYFPWISLAIAMLDSYVDRFDDASRGDHSYIAHYGDDELATRRLREIVDRTLRETNGLRNGTRHAVIAGCMVAMYLSRERDETPEMRARTLTLVTAGGSLTRLLLPLLRIWRAARLPYPRARREHALARGGPHARSPGLPVRVGGARQALAALRVARSPGLRLPRAMQTFLFWKAPLEYLERCRDRYGSSFTLRATSHPPLVFLSDPGDIKTMLAAPAEVLHPGEGADTIEELVGDESFMLREGEEHLNGRRLILPHFHARVVHEHAGLVDAVARREIAAWPLGTPFALHPRLRALTLETLLRTILGASGALADARLYALRDRLLRMLAVTASTVLPAPLLRHGPGRGVWRRFLRDRTEVDELLYSIIEGRGRLQDGCGDTIGHGDMLGTLLGTRNADGSQMTPRQVRDNLMSIVLAGHETTASELAWAFQLLAHNPRVLARLIEEIDADGGEEYLTATVREVLRHRPVFLFTIPRAVKQAIEIGGWTYRPPAQLLGCIYLVHHDPELYPEPDEFRPERFLESSPGTYTWLPWGGGRKRCPGLHLAMLEMKTVLRTVLETMTIKPAARKIEHPRWRSVIVTPHAGSRVVLQQRRR